MKRVQKMPDNINEPKSQILDALRGNYTQPQGNIQEPKSPILQAILDGGGGSYDDSEIKVLIAKNTHNINRIAEFLGIDLTYEYLPFNGLGVIMPDGVGIDTGLTLNGNAIFRFKGCLRDDTHQVCLIGARTGTSTSERTCINVLPQSGQIQSQWANNAYKVLKDDMNFIQIFDVIADKNQTIIAQNGVDIATINNGGFENTNPATPICLFNQALDNAQYYSPLLKSAEIEINGGITTFEPMIKRNIETGAETVVLCKNGVDMNIDGLTDIYYRQPER